MAKKIVNQEIYIKVNLLIEESGDNWTCYTKGCFKRANFVTHVTFYWGNFTETKDKFWCPKHLTQIYKTNQKLIKGKIPEFLTYDV